MYSDQFLESIKEEIKRLEEVKSGCDKRIDGIKGYDREWKPTSDFAHKGL